MKAPPEGLTSGTVLFYLPKNKGMERMDEEEVIEVDVPDKNPLTEAKLKKLKNLKYFRDWPEEKILEWYQLRHGDDERPPASPDDVGKDKSVSSLEAPTPPPDTLDFDPDEYKKKYNAALSKYRKEYAVDMNETNDAEALKSLVRYVLQLEKVDEIINKESGSRAPDHRTLKGLGDFQRSLQMNLNELQDKLGISRKQRKEKTHDDIPQYINALQQKAKDFWNRKTVSVRCETCQIELARYWLNFPDKIQRVEFNATCEQCGQEVVYVV
jgi:hypothetical protein